MNGPLNNAQWPGGGKTDRIRQRRFVYKGARSNVSKANITTTDSGNFSEGSSTFTPRKKHKSFHDGNNMSLLTADLMNDLPADTFDDDMSLETDMGDMGEEDFDFDDNVAEELERIEIEASQRLATPPKSETDVLETRGIFGGKSSRGHTKGNTNNVDKFITVRGGTNNLDKPTCQNNGNSHKNTTVCGVNGVQNMAGYAGTKAAVATPSVSQDQLVKLQGECANYCTKIQQLEEDTFSKAGEIKVLRDSLERMRSEETLHKNKIKTLVEQQSKIENDRIKELLKQVESLQTRIQFKEREIMEIVEQNKSASTVKSKPGESLGMVPSFTSRNPPPCTVKLVTNVSVCNSPKSNIVKNQTSPRASKTNKLPSSSRPASSNSSPGSSTPRLQPLVECIEQPLEQSEVQCSVNIVHAGSVIKEVLQSEESSNMDSYKLNPSDTYGAELTLLFQQIPNNKVDYSLLYCQGNHIAPQTATLFDTQTPSTSTASLDKQDSSASRGVLAIMSDHLSCPMGITHFVSNDEDSTKSVDNISCILPVLESHLVKYAVERSGTLDLDSSPISQTTSGKDISGGKLCKQASFGMLTLFHNAFRAVKVLHTLLLYNPYLRKLLICKNVEEICQNVEERYLWSSQGQTKPQKKKVGENSADVKYLLNSFVDLNYEEAHKPVHLLQALIKLIVPIPGEPEAFPQTIINVFTLVTGSCPGSEITRLKPLLSEGIVSQVLSSDFSVTTLQSILNLLIAMSSQPDLVQIMCSKSDSCLLLKVYEILLAPVDLALASAYQNQCLYEKVIEFLSSLSHQSVLLENECPCSVELIKNLVLSLYRILMNIQPCFVSDFQSRQLLRNNLKVFHQGVSVLISICSRTQSLLDHRVDIEHELLALLKGVLKKGKIPKTEVNVVQDLLDDLLGSTDEEEEDDEEEENMEIDS